MVLGLGLKDSLTLYAEGGIVFWLYNSYGKEFVDGFISGFTTQTVLLGILANIAAFTIILLLALLALRFTATKT